MIQWPEPAAASSPEPQPPVSDGALRLPEGLTLDRVAEMYRMMILLRVMDERALKLQRTGKIGFCVTCTGEEAAVIGSGAALQGNDWVFPSYRQYGIPLLRGIPVEAVAANWFGNTGEVTKGRQMPMHLSFSKDRFVSLSSVIGTQFIHAVGCAMGAKLKQEPCVAVGYIGDGGTSSSDFHSALTFAGVMKPPVLLICINNQYAISLPVHKQNGNPELWMKGQGYGVPSVRVDGNDLLAVYETVKRAADRAREGGGPTFIELLTYRAGSHSSSDDPSRYRSAEEQNTWAERDPLKRTRALLASVDAWSDADEEAAWQAARDRVAEAVAWAEQQPNATWPTMFDDVYAEVPPSLAAQRDELLRHESGLALANEGEFPL